MIVSQAELTALRAGKRRAFWIPVAYGSFYEEGRTESVKRPLPCPLKPESKRNLQLAPFTASVGTITITSATITALADADPRPAGYKFLAQARAAYEAKHGTASDDMQIWVVKFAVGDLAELYENLGERYLRRSMAGAHDFTTNPALAVRGEGAVPRETEMRFARVAAAQRKAASQRQLELALKGIRAAIATMDNHELEKAVRDDLAWMRRRAQRLERAITETRAAA